METLRTAMKSTFGVGPIDIEEAEVRFHQLVRLVTVVAFTKWVGCLAWASSCLAAVLEVENGIRTYSA
jgi:hypothetical protein